MDERVMSTPRETAAEVYPWNGDDPNAIIAMQQAFVNGWQASRADLAQHRDDIARVLAANYGWDFDEVLASPRTADRAGVVLPNRLAARFRRDADVVLAYLTGGDA